ncbi:Crp/Fnr family transcriptional regulator [Listeria booriae]|uniref:Crp/Fnr family transcriptional regulator n=1 Tax=Listeria booriae TaxID=1552123 RepID=UPI001629688A|nr:Crp/Fnr family transcriptional regulator [Listeria booriae]MBC2159880.1 Crp/Fnr family transcriptional regulator [Listeria booriae]MBC2164535.1 Crp/Fnr family transcriptional regulator [Listeria booriae]MBC2170537.1 Crp/Fnr family transcriptional regulator [Listeria booriae]MBC2174369.1 Crp/Fnr family transcriptional regulator [Listeria booriae]MBC2196493.1 Crp/Fnr family transcriptional regulator [Listeria booriae]
MENMLMQLYDNEVLKDNFSSVNLLEMISSVEHHEMVIKGKQEVSSDGEYVYYICQGKVLTERAGTILAISGEGEFVGLDALLREEYVKDTFVGLEKGFVLKFRSEEVLLKLLSLQEGWVYLLAQEKLRNENLVRNNIYIHQSGKEKLKYVLSYLAEQFGTWTEKGIVIPRCFNKTIIANYANITLTSLRRIMRVLVIEDWLEMENYTLIIKE